MARFVVLEPDGGPAEQAVFVRDGFHLLALLLPFVWLLFQRLWFAAFTVLGVSILLGLAGGLLGIGHAVPLFSLLVGLFVALEGPQWTIARLTRKGFRARAALEAANLDEAEIRYFSGREAPEPAKPPLPVGDGRTPRPALSSFGQIGLVGHRGEN